MLMKQKDRRARLLQRTDWALAALGDVRAELEGRCGQPPRPSHVFVFAATRELDVEWVPADAASGPLSLRCRFGAWLGAEDFHPGHRTGLLPPETLARARHRRAARGVGSTAREQEAESDPEYGRWVEEVLVRASGAVARPSHGAG